MICASVYLLVFIQNLFAHLAEKILLMQPLTFGGYPSQCLSLSQFITNPSIVSCVPFQRPQTASRAVDLQLSPRGADRLHSADLESTCRWAASGILPCWPRHPIVKDQAHIGGIPQRPRLSQSCVVSVHAELWSIIIKIKGSILNRQSR